MIDKSLLVSQAAELGVKIDDEASDRFDKYAQMLVETNKTLNLTAITEPDEIVSKHFVDCLSVFNFVDFPKGAKIIDVGTGAGFPGLPILIANPELEVNFLDSSQKRIGFIKDVLNNNLH